MPAASGACGSAISRARSAWEGDLDTIVDADLQHVIAELAGRFGSKDVAEAASAFIERRDEGR